MPSPPPDPSAADTFCELFERTHRPLLAYAVRRVADPADAADVVAETFLTAWRRMEEIPEGGQARPWLFGVARRVLANLYRSQRRRHALVDDLANNLREVYTPASDHDPSLSEAMRQLGEDDQEILRLVAWEGLAREEIAVALGVSRATARVRLHRARRRLAALLDQAGIDLPEGARPPPAPAAATTSRTVATSTRTDVLPASARRTAEES